MQVNEVPEESVGGKLIVSLRNLSPSEGSFDTRATINFSRDFVNYVEVATESGPLRLHLHRDGSLQLEPDDGGFT